MFPSISTIDFVPEEAFEDVKKEVIYEEEIDEEGNHLRLRGVQKRNDLTADCNCYIVVVFCLFICIKR